MPICHQHKFIFLHIPRCAGTSVERHFDLVSASNLYGVIRADVKTITLHHLTLNDLRQAELIDHDTMAQYFKFTIIRDPFDRMASDYLWQQRHDPHSRFSAMSFADFIEFARSVIVQGRYFDELHLDHFRPMSSYCFDGDDMILDDILLLEDLDQELTRLRPLLGTITLPHKNLSVTPYDDLRTGEDQQRVYELYAADKALFDSLGRIRTETAAEAAQ